MDSAGRFPGEVLSGLFGHGPDSPGRAAAQDSKFRALPPAMPSVTERRPTRLARTAVFMLLWLVAGVFCYVNDFTDAPPGVARREAMIQGLLLPLTFVFAV